MQINNEMRFTAATELAKRVYLPKLEKLTAKLTEDDTTRIAETVAALATSGKDYSRFDNLKPGDTPEIACVTVSFRAQHVINGYQGKSDTYGLRSTSPFYHKALVAKLFLENIHPLFRGEKIKLAKPIRIPYSTWVNTHSYDRALNLASNTRREELEDGTIVDSPVITLCAIGEHNREVVKHRTLVRAWKHFEASMELIRDAMEFWDNTHKILSTCKTTESLKKKWPDIHDDFLELNGLNPKSKSVAIPTVDQTTLNSMNHLIRKSRADQAKQEAA